MKFEFLALILLLAFPISAAVSYQDSDVAQQLDRKCSASDQPTVNSEHTVTLNGTEVDNVQCNNLDQYEYPDTVDPGFILEDSTPSIHEALLIGLRPFVALLGLSIFILAYDRKYARKENLIRYLVTPVLSTGFGFLALFLVSSYINYPILGLLPLLAGILTPFILLISREKEVFTRKNAFKIVYMTLVILSAFWLFFNIFYSITGPHLT